MEQNFYNQQESQYQEFQQFNIDIETSDEAELRYKQFMEEEMNRKALLPKYLESSALNHEITESDRQNQIQEENQRQEKNSIKCIIFGCCFFYLFLAVIFSLFSNGD